MAIPKRSAKDLTEKVSPLYAPKKDTAQINATTNVSACYATRKDIKRIVASERTIEPPAMIILDINKNISKQPPDMALATA